MAALVNSIALGDVGAKPTRSRKATDHRRHI